MAGYKYIIGLILVNVLFVILSILQGPTFTVDRPDGNVAMPYYYIGIAFTFYLIIVAVVYFLIRDRQLITILKKLHFIAIALLTVLLGLWITIPYQLYETLGIGSGQVIGNDVAFIFVLVLMLIAAQLLLPFNVIISIFKHKLNK